MPPDSHLFINSTRGDAIYRDAYIRGLSLSDNSRDIQQGAYYINDSGYAILVSEISNTYDAVNDIGSWSCFVKPANTSLDSGTAVPQLYVSTSNTTITSDTLTLSGTLQVNNYCVFLDDLDIRGDVSVGQNLTVSGTLQSGYTVFNDDVDILQGNVTIGNQLTVDGGISVGTVLIVNDKVSSTSVQTNAIDFSSKWRILFDESQNGILFQENVSGTFITRGGIGSSGYI